MAAQWCIEGLQELMDAAFKDDATPEDKLITLFTNDETIVDATAYGDLTIADYNGAEAQTLTKANWDAATSADPVVSAYYGGTGVIFSFTGTANVYGWAIIGSASDKVYAAENFGIKHFDNGESLTLSPINLSLDIPE